MLRVIFAVFLLLPLPLYANENNTDTTDTTTTSTTSTTTLPPIKYQKPTHRGTKGTQTIPTFTVNSDSSYRSATMVALGIEAIL